MSATPGLARQQPERAPAIAYWVALALVLAAFTAWQWLPAKDAVWSYDEGLEAIKAALVLDGQALYADIWSDYTPLFTYGLAALFAGLGDSLFAGRMLVVAFGLAGIVGAAWAARRLAGDVAGIAAALFLAAMPLYQINARLLMVGLPSVAVGALALAAALASCDKPRLWLAAVSGLLFAASLMLKPITAPYYVGIMALLFLAPNGPLRKRVTAAAIWHLACFAGVLAVVATTEPRAFASQVIGTVLASSSDASLPLLARAQELVRMLVDTSADTMLAPLAVLAAIGGGWLIAKGDWRPALGLALALGGSLVGLMLNQPLYAHHLTLLAPCLTVLTGVGVAFCVEAWGRLRRHRSERRSWLAVALLTLALAAAVVTLVGGVWRGEQSRALPTRKYDPNNWRNQALAVIEAQTEPSDTIITDDPMLAFLTGRALPAEIAVATHKRIATGRLTAQQLIDVTAAAQPSIVVYQERFAQFTGFVAWLNERYVVLDQDQGERFVMVPHAPNAQTQVAWTFGSLSLDGALVPTTVLPGEEATLRLYWRYDKRPTSDVQAYVHLVDDDGILWGQADTSLRELLRAAGTSAEDARAATDLTIAIAPDAPPGPMTLWLGLYRLPAGQRLPLVDVLNQPLDGDQVALAFRPVVRWEPVHQVGEVARQCDIALGNTLALQGYTLPRDPVSPGETIALSLAWRCLAPTDTNLSVFVHLVDGNSQLVAQSDGPPDAGRKPTYAWLSDEIILEERAIPLPQDLSAQELRVLVGMYDPATGARLGAADGADHVVLGELAVQREHQP